MKHSARTWTAMVILVVLGVCLSGSQLVARDVELQAVKDQTGNGAAGRVLVTRPGGLDGLSETRMLTLGAMTHQAAAAELDRAGGWAEFDLLWYEPIDPLACGLDSTSECAQALEAACQAHSGQVQTMEFASKEKCTGTCSGGQTVTVSCSRQ